MKCFDAFTGYNDLFCAAESLTADEDFNFFSGFTACGVKVSDICRVKRSGKGKNGSKHSIFFQHFSVSANCFKKDSVLTIA
jgi:hypothetical protein